MKILLICLSLASLFAVALLLAYRMKNAKNLYIANSLAVGVGFVLLLISKRQTNAIIFFVLFLIWVIMGTVAHRFGRAFSDLIDKALCRLSGQPYEQMKDDKFDDHAPETAMKIRYHIIAIGLYVFYLMAVLPEVI